jgi:excisionase family DNA binding protein
MDDVGVLGNQVLTLTEAARFIRVSEKTLGGMARDGRIPAQKVGREWRFLRHALEDWLQGTLGRETVSEPSALYNQLDLFEETAPVEGIPKTSNFGDTAFTRNRREPMHRWVPWIAGFSASFVEAVFDSSISAPPREVTVLDPFSGVGTTLVEGLKRGYNVVGFEINPYAALACKVKLKSSDCDVNRLTEAVKRMEGSVSEKIRLPGEDPKSERPPGFKSRVPFFSPSVEKQVLLIKDLIDSLETGLVQDLFRVALGSVMVSFSNYSYEPSLSTRAAAGKNGIHDADVVKILSTKLWEMVADVSFLQKHLARFDYRPQVEIHPRSYLNASNLIPDGSVDVLITSPPYLNNYHYIRNTRPQLYWLDLVNGPGDLRTMEKESFGQFWQTSRSGPDIELRVDIPELHEVLDLIRGLNPEKGDYGGRGWANYAASYFNDCDRFCEVTRAVMKPGGRVVIVIGNNILQGVEVKTDEFLARISERHGFEVLRLHRVRKKRTGSSIVNSSVRTGVMKKGVELYETAVELMAPRP